MVKVVITKVMSYRLVCVKQDESPKKADKKGRKKLAKLIMKLILETGAQCILQRTIVANSQRWSEYRWGGGLKRDQIMPTKMSSGRENIVGVCE